MIKVMQRMVQTMNSADRANSNTLEEGGGGGLFVGQGYKRPHCF